MDANLVRRIAFAAVAIPLALLVWFGGWPLVALLALAAALGTAELFDLARRQRIGPAVKSVCARRGLAPVAYVALSSMYNTWWVVIAGFYVAALWLMVLLGGPSGAAHRERPLAAVAITLFGVAYAGVLPSFLMVIRHNGFGLRSWAGTALVFFPLVVTWVCDTAAMFGGSSSADPSLRPPSAREKPSRERCLEW